MYKDILNSISEKTEQIGIEDFKKIKEATESKLLKPHKSSLAVVSEQYGKLGVFNAIKKICGCDDTCFETFPKDDTPFCVTFVNGVEGTLPYITDELLDDKKTKYKKIVIQTSGEGTQQADISYYCGFELSTLGAKVLEQHDWLVMFTNAVMAMNINEKKWIKETVEPFFGCDRFSAVLFNTQLLNTEDDFNSVCESVKGILNGVNPDAGFYKTADEFGENIMNVFENAVELNEKRCKSIVKNCVADIIALAKKQMEAKNIDIEKLKALTQKVEKERKSIEISGRIAVSTNIENLYSDIKYQIFTAAEKYVDEAYTNIINRISETQDLEKDVSLIHSYLEKVLSVFETNVEEKIAEENAKIINTLEEQLETDCNSLLKIVDIPEVRNFISDNDNPASFDINESKSKVYSGKDTETIKKNEMVSKGMLIASVVSTLFVSPVMGIALLAGRTILNKHNEKENQTATRNNVLEQLAADREELKLKVRTQIDENLIKIKEDTKKSVSEAYKNVIDSIADSIISSVEKVEKAKEEYEALSKLANIILPEIITTLN